MKKLLVISLILISIGISACNFMGASVPDETKELPSNNPAPHAADLPEVELNLAAKAKLAAAHGKEVKKIDFATFQKMLQRKNDTLYIYNFWATFSEPSIRQLEVFEKVQLRSNEKDTTLTGEVVTTEDNKVKVINISIDNPKLLEKRVVPFIREKQIESKVVLLDGGERDIWIREVSHDWSGAIPATLLVADDTSIFYERSFDYSEILAIIQPLILKKKKEEPSMTVISEQ